MARVHVTTKHGAKITVEGTPEEVAFLVSRLEGGAAPSQKRTKTAAHGSRPRPTPTNLITDFIDGGFFKKPKELSAIKLALEEQGHYYPVTSLSPTLLRLVRKRQLRRIKDQKRWLYVN
jgi:hypothetical protein